MKWLRWLPGPVLGPETKLMPSVQDLVVTHWTSCVFGSRNIDFEGDRGAGFFLLYLTCMLRPLPFDFTRRSVV